MTDIQRPGRRAILWHAATGTHTTEQRNQLIRLGLRHTHPTHGRGTSTPRHPTVGSSTRPRSIPTPRPTHAQRHQGDDTVRIGSADTWRPLGARIIPAREVVAGDLLAFNHQVWRVLETSLRDDPARPYRIVTRPIKVETIQTHHDSDRHTVWARYSMAYTFPDEHYPVCVKCFEPLPCREQIIQKAMNESQQRTRRYETPNVCPACQEPITNRQLRQTWPENLIALTGQPVTIHLRRECVDEAKRYDQLWTDAGRMSQLGFDARKETP